MRKKIITIPMVKAAYKKCGFIPIAHFNFDFANKMCCPIVALYLANVKTDLITLSNNSSRAFLWAYKKFGTNYVEGFIQGVDNYPGWGISRENIAFKEGNDVRKALKL